MARRGRARWILLILRVDEAPLAITTKERLLAGHEEYFYRLLAECYEWRRKNLTKELHSFLHYPPLAPQMQGGARRVPP